MKISEAFHQRQATLGISSRREFRWTPYEKRGHSPPDLPRSPRRHLLASRLRRKRIRGSRSRLRGWGRGRAGIIGSQSKCRRHPMVTTSSANVDIPDADTALSERPHGHDIKTLK